MTFLSLQLPHPFRDFLCAFSLRPFAASVCKSPGATVIVQESPAPARCCPRSFRVRRGYSCEHLTGKMALSLCVRAAAPGQLSSTNCDFGCSRRSHQDGDKSKSGQAKNSLDLNTSKSPSSFSAHAVFLAFAREKELHFKLISNMLYVESCLNSDPLFREEGMQQT